NLTDVDAVVCDDVDTGCESLVTLSMPQLRAMHENLFNARANIWGQNLVTLDLPRLASAPALGLSGSFTTVSLPAFTDGVVSLGGLQLSAVDLPNLTNGGVNIGSPG